VILTCKFVRDFSPIYVTIEQKADVCNSFQVIMQTDTHIQTQHTIKCIILARVHDNCTTISSNQKIIEPSDRHTKLKIILPHYCATGSKNLASPLQNIIE